MPKKKTPTTAADWLVSQARQMIRRALRFRRRAHQRLG